MEIVLGDLVQYPFPSQKYQNGFQLKTAQPIEIKSNESKLVKANLFIKHTNDTHFRIFIADQFADTLKLNENCVKLPNKEFQYTIINISDNTIIIPEQTHLVDIVWSDVLTNNIYLLDSNVINITLSLESSNNITNNNNEPLSLNDINNNI